MEGLLHIPGERFEFNRVVNALERGEFPVLINNIAEGQRQHLLAYCQRQLDRPVLFIAKDDYEATGVLKGVQAFCPEGVYHYPQRDTVFYPVEGRSYEWEHLRIRTIDAIRRGKARIVVTTIGALLQFLPPRQAFCDRFFTLEPGQRMEPEQLCQRLVEAGYVHAETIEGVGQFSRRGYLVDVYSPVEDQPLRIEFFDDEIDTIAPFDLLTQRRGESAEQARIAPVKEQLLLDRPGAIATLESLVKRARLSKRDNREEIVARLAEDLERVREGGELLGFDRYFSLLQSPAMLEEYFPGEFGVLLSDYQGIKKAAEDIQWQMNEDVKELLTQMVGYGRGAAFQFDFTEVLRRLEKRPTVITENFNNSSFDIPIRTLISLAGKGLSSFTSFEFLQEEVQYYREKRFGMVICASTPQRVEKLRQLLEEEGVPAAVVTPLERLPQPGECVLTVASSGQSMEYETAALAILSEKHGAEAVGRRKTTRRKAARKKEPLFYNDLKPGDLVVHSNYGIGRFVGIEKIEIEKTAKDYVKIAFAGSDTLFVPCNQLDLISKYVGSENRQVKLSKMGGGEWNKTKARVKAAAKEMARELIALYAARQQLPGHAFPPDDELQADFEAKFPYEETDDQLRCAEEIKRDMERTVPMDRLLCGDVGFGKTEVAMRAIFKCICGGKQAAVLVPTTLLAQQHYTTMLERFEGYPVRIQVLSRFRTKKQQEEILRDVKNGMVDVVIGTHRLLQKDVKFKDLGLLVVDEEQRFGVLHKEKLKELARNVHCLTLSATPIPRTLNMAMSGIRDMSTIDEPPRDRHPVATYVCAYEPGVIRDAIARELRRGGQVFYLYNNTEHIAEEAAKIQRLVPQANVEFAHGKMTEQEISAVMGRFLDREADVLVCTTIIETGIDIPNANTLIITKADHLGLAQLYQIRGRVGRSTRRAYAYLTYEAGRVLPEDAVKRLMAIKEYTEFGSGFKIAMRDLQIRGAGSILGTSQHGHMENVGYDMYLKLLSEAVLEENGQEKSIPVSCTVDLFINAYIPESYIHSGETRIEIYKKIAALQTPEDALDIRDELIDRFGDIPESVNNLVDIALMRNRASALGIREISQKGEKLYVYPTDLTLEGMTALTQSYQKRITFLSGKQTGFVIQKLPQQSGAQAISEMLDLL
ncbi:MAG: transcription-repair coupling factor [Eubacteriales bacterium]|jgi:transcription-repair coupling factor (superfamily II helicase)